MVSNKWSEFKERFNAQSYSLDKWHGCQQALRKHLKGCNLNLVGTQRENKNLVTKRIEEIDIAAESRLLTIKKWEDMIDLEKQTEDTNVLEEIFVERYLISLLSTMNWFDITLDWMMNQFGLNHYKLYKQDIVSCLIGRGLKSWFSNFVVCKCMRESNCICIIESTTTKSWKNFLKKILKEPSNLNWKTNGLSCIYFCLDGAYYYKVTLFSFLYMNILSFDI